MFTQSGVSRSSFQYSVYGFSLYTARCGNTCTLHYVGLCVFVVQVPRRCPVQLSGVVQKLVENEIV